ncbi:MAG: HAMP domain-containing histidine kinase [Propionibacteriaceae bacterium]|jgi:signal transduction histidine kinase|nr:HAMP domain-containing histidine kinase [Propionibacteriaceae bacterium]
MRKLSLRIVLTGFVILLLTGVSLILTFAALHNADETFFVKIPDVGAIESAAPTPPEAPSDAVTLAPAPGAVDNPPAGAVPPDPAGQIGGVLVRTQFTQRTLWAMVAVIVGGGVATWFLLGRALRPLRTLTGQIATITETDLSTPIGDPGSNDEISSLARSFNTMTGRLGKVFADQKRFSSDAAHELKTPLTVIRTSIDVLHLNPEPSSEEYERTIEVVDKQSRRMARLVDDLFALSAQRGFATDDAVDIDSMIGDIIEQLRPGMEERDLHLTVAPSGFHTTANAVMLMRAFSNLIENAIKYNTPGGQIDIAARTEPGWLILDIADTGVGIPADKLDAIFDPFWRADTSRSRKVGGTGLGLAITREIIERHGGRVHATRGAGSGMVFTVMLPA